MRRNYFPWEFSLDFNAHKFLRILKAEHFEIPTVSFFKVFMFIFKVILIYKIFWAGWAASTARARNVTRFFFFLLNIWNVSSNCFGFWQDVQKFFPENVFTNNHHGTLTCQKRNKQSCWRFCKKSFFVKNVFVKNFFGVSDWKKWNFYSRNNRNARFFTKRPFQSVLRASYVLKEDNSSGSNY